MSEDGQPEPTIADPPPAERNELVAQEPRRGRGGIPGNSGGKKGRSGPPGHTNAMKDGAFCTRLTLTKFPRKLQHVARAVNTLREPLESAVVNAHGGIDVTHAAIVREALTQERLLRIWGKRLLDHYDQLDDEGLARITDRIERYTRLCSAAIRSLELRAKAPEGFWDAKSQPAA